MSHIIQAIEAEAAKLYRIVEGSFRDTDGSIKGVGDTIELADHDAAAHGLAVTPVTSEGEQEPAASLADKAAFQSPAADVPALPADPT